MVVLLLCLVAGLLGVAWRAKARVDRTRARARAEASAVAASVELQFSHAQAAVEVLGTLVRQSAGRLLNFPKAAEEVLATQPGVASLELQPGGIVSDIVPRRGNERAIGFNALKDPARRLAVNMAIQKRTVTVAGPVALIGGEPGIVVMTPIFQGNREGREALWGFVAATVRVSDMLGRAGINELARKGYDYVFFAPGAAQQLAESGTVSLDKAVLQSIRVRNAEWRLGLQPRGGWISRGEVALDLVVVLLVSGLLCLLVIANRSQRDLQIALASENQQLLRKTADAEQAQDGLRKAQESAAVVQTELKQAQSALQQVEADNRALQARLEAVTRGAKETEATAQANLEQADRRIAALRAQVDDAVKAAADASQTQQADLERAERTIGELQAQLDEALKPAQANPQALPVELERADQTQAAIHQLEASHRDLQARLEAATRAAKETEAIAQAKLERAERTIAESQAQLDKSLKVVQAVPQALPVEFERAHETQPAIQQVEASDQELQTRPEAATRAAKETDEPVHSKLEDTKARKAPRRRKSEPNDQMSLWGAQSSADEPNVRTQAEAPATQTAGEEIAPALADAAAPASEARPDEQLSPSETAEVVRVEPPEEIEPPMQLEEETVPKPKEHKSVPARSGAPRLHPDFRKMVNQILPLLSDQDPGARDCLKANRTIFRSGFTPESYVEFEQFVKDGEFNTALEHLRKAAKRNGFSV